MRKPIKPGNNQTPFVGKRPIGSPGYEHTSKPGKAPPKTPKALPPQVLPPKVLVLPVPPPKALLPKPPPPKRSLPKPKKN